MMNEVTIDRDYPDKDGEAIIDVHDGKIYQVFSNSEQLWNHCMGLNVYKWVPERASISDSVGIRRSPSLAPRNANRAVLPRPLRPHGRPPRWLLAALVVAGG